MVKQKRALEILLAVGLTALGLYVLSGAGEVRSDRIEVGAAWARPTYGRIANGAAYLEITNTGPRADTLLAIEGDAARSIEIHEHVRDGDIMRMRAVKEGVTVGPGQTSVFAPGGHHIMLIGLTAPLKEGDSLALTLVFERSGRIPIEVPVRRQAP